MRLSHPHHFHVSSTTEVAFGTRVVFAQGWCTHRGRNPGYSVTASGTRSYAERSHFAVLSATFPVALLVRCWLSRPTWVRCECEAPRSPLWEDGLGSQKKPRINMIRIYVLMVEKKTQFHTHIGDILIPWVRLEQRCETR